ncbi:hypothetical protein TNCT_377921 [Trichonephila clavata]|uniref:Uncharacterized protein n=1 Tax=Trichonephila clavata TaxID=2740835 RepID=A0A8X6G8M7_TRICU|nr:hypothetical protein TNCT_377921 [Trichonephila clavata]
MCIKCRINFGHQCALTITSISYIVNIPVATAAALSAACSDCLAGHNADHNRISSEPIPVEFEFLRRGSVEIVLLCVRHYSE